MAEKMMRLRLTPNGVAVADPQNPDQLVELRLTKESGVSFSAGRIAATDFVELQLGENGVVVRDPNSNREYQALTFSEDGILIGAPGNVA